MRGRAKRDTRPPRVDMVIAEARRIRVRRPRPRRFILRIARIPSRRFRSRRKKRRGVKQRFWVSRLR